MSRAARFFKALKLVELDETDAATSPDPESDLPEPSDSPIVAPVATVLNGDDDLAFPEGVALDGIYSAAGVPQTAFTVERLGKLLEGLSQLDPATKQTAVHAMDAADDTWTIDDAVADAGNKIKALDAHISQLGELERGITGEVQRRIEANLGSKKTTIEEIDAQIQALEKQREATIAESATEVARLRAQGTAATDAADRERRRLTETIKQYQGQTALFGTPNRAPSSKS